MLVSMLALAGGIGASLLAAYGTWGVPGEWQWQRRTIPMPRWWMPLLPSLLILVLSVWLVRRSQASRRINGAWCLIFVVLALALQLTTLGIAPNSTVYAGAVIMSPVATTYFDEAGKITDMPEFLRDYATRMRAFSQHAQTYPPGPIVYFWAVRQIVSRSTAIRSFGAVLVAAATGLSPGDVAGAYSRLYRRPVSVDAAIAAILAAWRLAILGCLTVLPVFFLARDRWGDRAAVCAAAFCATIPSLILFTPSILQAVTLETALVLYLFHLALSRRSRIWAAFAGATWTIAALTSLAVLAVVPLLVVWAAVDRLTAAGGNRRTRMLWSLAAAWIASALGLFVLAFLLFGINYPAILASALGAHREVTTQAFARTYSRWLGWNLFDFWMFLGAGLGLWMLWQMGEEIAALRRRQFSSLTPLLWAAVLTIAALDLSGVVRAEVGRIWMFLMPPAAVALGRYVASLERAETVLALLLAAQLIQIWAFQQHLALFVVL
jgi:hypothetical protein